MSIEENEIKETNLDQLIEKVEADDIPTNEFTVSDTDPLVLLGKINEVIANLNNINNIVNNSGILSNQALDKAIEALNASITALTTSNTAISSSNTALETSNTALETSNTALETSNNALQSALKASYDASEALNQVVNGLGTQIVDSNEVVLNKAKFSGGTGISVIYRDIDNNFIISISETLNSAIELNTINISTLNDALQNLNTHVGDNTDRLNTLSNGLADTNEELNNTKITVNQNYETLLNNFDNYIRKDGQELTDTEIKNIKEIFNINPIGTIIITKNPNYSPASVHGGTWELIAENRVLMGTYDATKVGTLIEAGLPNITGSLDIPNGNRATGNTYFDVQGAFKHYGNAWDSGNAGGAGVGGRIGFEASSSNSIYGNSSTVQPPALMVYIWERTA